MGLISGSMIEAANGLSGSAGICRACGTNVAQSAVSFYCAKSSEMKVGAVPIYRFETPLCDDCIKEGTSRRIRRYWIVSLAIMAAVGLAIAVLAWTTLSKGTSDTLVSRIVGSLLLGGASGAVILLFAGIISIQMCSKKFVAAQMAVKPRKAELDKAGYTGYWMNPPKRIELRRY